MTITYFKPSLRYITDITRTNPAVVTTSVDHKYLSGLNIRVVIPYSSGMQQVNNNVYDIIVLSSNTFSIPVNATGFDSFVSNSKQQAQSIPVSEDANMLTMATINNNNIIPQTTWIT